jgi:hypothetical protein
VTTRLLRILVVEDGHEYSEAFSGLSPSTGAGSPEFVRAGDFLEAQTLLEKEGPVDAVFIDTVFDRTPAARLAGDLESAIARFGGDRRRAERHLSENQGFYVLDALAPLLENKRVVLAFDFSEEPERLEVLRKRIPGLTGVPDGAALSQVVRSLLSG